MEGNLGEACSTATPVITSIFKVLSSATTQQSFAFWSDYVSAHTIIAVTFTTVAVYYLNRIRTVLLVSIPIKTFTKSPALPISGSGATVPLKKPQPDAALQQSQSRRQITLGDIAAVVLLSMMVYLWYDYIYPRSSFKIRYPVDGAAIAANDTANGTAAFDPNFPFLISIIEDNAELAKPYTITDIPQIDDVGTWSAKIHARKMKSNTATLHFVLVSDMWREQIINSRLFDPVTPIPFSRVEVPPIWHCDRTVKVTLTPPA